MKLYFERGLTGLIILALGLLMRAFCYSQIEVQSISGITPRAIPILVSSGVIILSLVLILQGIMSYVKDRNNPDAECSKIIFMKFPFILFGLMVLYAVAMLYLGYFIASFTVLPLILFVLRVRSIKSYITVFLLVIVVYLMIDVFLKIGLPKFGWLGII